MDEQRFSQLYTVFYTFLPSFFLSYSLSFFHSFFLLSHFLSFLLSFSLSFFPSFLPSFFLSIFPSLSICFFFLSIFLPFHIRILPFNQYFSRSRFLALPHHRFLPPWFPIQFIFGLIHFPIFAHLKFLSASLSLSFLLLHIHFWWIQPVVDLVAASRAFFHWNLELPPSSSLWLPPSPPRMVGFTRPKVARDMRCSSQTVAII